MGNVFPLKMKGVGSSTPFFIGTDKNLSKLFDDEKSRMDGLVAIPNQLFYRAAFSNARRSS
jgi:hypothetical protein